MIIVGDLHEQCAVVDAQDDCSTTGHYGSHFDSIAAGNLARPIAVYGRNEITAILPA